MKPSVRGSICSDHMLVKTSTESEVFNYRLIRARRFVECTFDILASKLGVFLSGMMVQPDFVELITKTACEPIDGFQSNLIGS
jgi:hypothetical protein